MHLRRWCERRMARFSRQLDSHGVSYFTQSRERGGGWRELALLQQIQIGGLEAKPPERVGRFLFKM